MIKMIMIIISIICLYIYIYIYTHNYTYIYIYIPNAAPPDKRPVRAGQTVRVHRPGAPGKGPRIIGGRILLW